MKSTNSLHCPKFNAEGGRYMGAKSNSKDCNIGLYGVPYDGTTSFRPGSRFGPSSIRTVSNGIESFCPQLNLDLENINFTDFGCLEIPYGAPEPVLKLVEEATNFFLAEGIKPLLLGGEHSITVGAIEAIANHHSDLILVQLDAHADLRQEWLGSSKNHACVMRRCLDYLPSNQIFQVGIRSGTKNEFEELSASKRLITHVHGQPALKLKEALQGKIGQPVYLTIDLDWFDPSIVPGTGTPEPGGFLWQDFAAIIDVLTEHQVIGADVVELSPQLDASGISSVLAAKVTRSMIMLLSKSE